MRFFQSVHLVIHLPLETLNLIIRASSPILVELTIFVSQMTLLTLLTFLFGSCSFGKIGKIQFDWKNYDHVDHQTEKG